LTDVMLFDALAAIAFVPVKSFDLRKVKHCLYYHNPVNENAGSITLTVIRSSGSGFQTVYVSTVQNEGNTNAGDYADVDEQPLILGPGPATASYTFSIDDLGLTSGSKTFGLLVQSAPSVTAPVLATGSFTIDDNDPPLSISAALSSSPTWNKIDVGTPTAMAGGDFEGLGSAQLAASESGGGTYIYVNGSGWTKIDGGVYSMMAAGDFYGTRNGNNNNADLAAYAAGAGTYIYESGAGLTKIDSGTVSAFAAGNFQGGTTADLAASELGAGTYLWANGGRLDQDRRRRVYADGGGRFLRHQQR